MSTDFNSQYHTLGMSNQDPMLTLHSDLTASRRKYPREHDGAKNEWHALIQHQSDVYKQIIQFEKELKNLRAQQLGQAYNQSLQQLIQSKEQQLQEKRNDQELMNFRIAQFKEVLKKKTLFVQYQLFRI